MPPVGLWHFTVAVTDAYCVWDRHGPLASSASVATSLGLPLHAANPCVY